MSESFGKWLKEERTSKNISLEEIAAVTKVHISQLRHLESDDVSKLPAAAFVRGFLIAYAKHLNLEPDDVLSRYKKAHGGDSVETPAMKTLRAAQSATQPKVKLVEGTKIKEAPGAKDLEKPTPALLKPKALSMIIGGIVLISLVIVLISLGKKSKKAKAVAAATTPAQSIAPNPTPPTDPAPTTTPNTAAATTPAAKTTAPSNKPSGPAPIGTKNYTLEIRGVQSSWVNVRIDDQDSVGGALNTGSSMTYQADKKMTLSLSDAGAVELRWNGTWYAAPGFRGDVKSLTLPDQLTSLTVRSAVAAKPVVKPKPVVAPPAAGEAAAPATPTVPESKPSPAESSVGD